MIIVDSALRARHQAGRPILTGLIGSGFMGRGLIHQTKYTPGVRIAAVCNRTLETAITACIASGVTDVTAVSTLSELDAVVSRGGTAVTTDASLLCASDHLECLIDATGNVEYGARVAVDAIEHGKHLILMNAELDGTVGPLLTARARERGVVVTGCDGDQPGVQINLARFVEGIGLIPRVCGNIKGLQDRYRNPTTQAGFAKRWGQSPAMVTSFADGTKISFEQAIVANATGMTVAQRGMIGGDHIGHVDELTGNFDIEMLREVGGIVDYVVGSQPSPGVFVFAEAHDDVQAHYLELGKLGTGPLYSFYVPYHLTVLEVPLTVGRAVEFHDAAIAPIAGPMVDVVTAAKIDLKAGETLDGLGEYHTYGVCETTPITRAERLLPIGLAEGCVLRRDVARDEVLTYDDVEVPKGRLIDKLRAEQDAMFPLATAVR